MTHNTPQKCGLLCILAFLANTLCSMLCTHPTSQLSHGYTHALCHLHLTHTHFPSTSHICTHLLNHTAWMVMVHTSWHYIVSHQTQANSCTQSVRGYPCLGTNSKLVAVSLPIWVYTHAFMPVTHHRAYPLRHTREHLPTRPYIAQSQTGVRPAKRLHGHNHACAPALSLLLGNLQRQ